jgi:hypothetical protein
MSKSRLRAASVADSQAAKREVVPAKLAGNEIGQSMNIAVADAGGNPALWPVVKLTTDTIQHRQPELLDQCAVVARVPLPVSW